MAGTLKLVAPELRDRRAGTGGSGSRWCAPCRCAVRTYSGMSFGDRILAWVTIFLLIANFTLFVKGPEEGEGGGEGGATAEGDATTKTPPFAKVKESVTGVKESVTGNLRSVKDKWDKMFIPPTPAPTMAPTEARVEETPADIATQIAAIEWAVPQFERPADCSADVLEKVKSSGMDGSGCKGKPYAQSCSTSVLSKSMSNAWIEGFMDEVVEMRKDGKGGGAQNATFVSVLLNNDCGKLATLLRFPKEVPESLTKWPWLWCSEPYESEETKKWGKVGSATKGSDMDEKMVSRELREAVKDVILAGAGEIAPTMFTGGMNTLARTRYVEFTYDWKGAWGSTDLKGVVEKMDAAGHTCYWAGAGKLWRITGCWQGFYGFKTWSHLACAHRVLAPKLAERMEGVFKTTVGME